MSLAALGPAVPSVERASLLLGKVERGEFVSAVRGPGTLVPKELRWISAETAARVERVVVKPGALVQQDSVIIELSNPQLEDMLLSAQAALSGAKADLLARRAELETQSLDAKSNLADVEAQYQMARAEVEAQAPVAAEGAMPKVQFRRAQITEESMKTRLAIEQQRLAMFQRNLHAQLAAGQARLAQLDTMVSLAKRQVEALKVRASIDGVLQAVSVEEGQQVQAGANLARVARPDTLRADVRIPETQAKSIALGQRASVDTRNGIVAGKVQRVDPAVINGTVMVEIEFEGDLPRGVRPDLSVDATVEVDRAAAAVFVARPAAAHPQSVASLFRVAQDQTYAERVPVRFGRGSSSSIEVLTGLAAGDTIILSDTSAFGDAERISLK
jgi:HlyD family secretion protein